MLRMLNINETNIVTIVHWSLFIFFWFHPKPCTTKLERSFYANFCFFKVRDLCPQESILIESNLVTFSPTVSIILLYVSSKTMAYRLRTNQNRGVYTQKIKKRKAPGLLTLLLECVGEKKTNRGPLGVWGTHYWVFFLNAMLGVFYTYFTT